MKFTIPHEVKTIAETLKKNGHQAYLVGGCLRDLLLKRAPKDWDVATNALPDEIQKIFSRTEDETPTGNGGAGTVYENTFGTVGVKTESDDPTLKIVEITTFRVEGRYTDLRHPDEVRFARTIEEDLARRDFTINSVALELPITNYQLLKIVDPFGGQEDLKNKTIRAVGDPAKRFEEDALRLMRAVRLATELGFEIEARTKEAIRRRAALLEAIAKERIRDEFVKLIMSDRAAEGVIAMEDLGLLRFVAPELREGIGCGQNKHHIYTVFDHNVRALNYAAEKKYSFEVRLASLLHDVGKPKTKRGDGPDSTFYNHEVVGAKMAAVIMDRLRFGNDVAERVVHLVRHHLFYYNVGEVSEAGVRRFIARVGPEYIEDLLKIREADRIGSGVPKAFPYKLRHLLFMMEKVKKDPIHPKMLAVKGDDIMAILGIPPGPKIGKILGVLLEEVLDDPKHNAREYLEPRVKELAALKDEELETLARTAREKKNEFESGLEEEMKKRYYVK
ncbi:MAG: HDIG domain-containing protein [Candidatus Brennerbacteria bacterium]|nr:HDIG domain-containing protein [Candidatus Brennerbacteria bacterium]